MKRFNSIIAPVLLCALTNPVFAQQSCAELMPLCPDDMAQAIGEIPNCTCPRPFSCEPNGFYECKFQSFSQSWSCSCTRPDTTPVEPNPVTPEPIAPPLGFCDGMVCMDGSRPRPDAGSCLCPDPG
jgi:hypothetical protein